jgi:hypothetical protein
VCWLLHQGVGLPRGLEQVASQNPATPTAEPLQQLDPNALKRLKRGGRDNQNNRAPAQHKKARVAAAGPAAAAEPASSIEPDMATAQRPVPSKR